MRRIFYYLPIFFIGLASCSVEEGITHKDNERVIIRAYHDTSTRVAFDGNSSNWEQGDILNVIINELEDVYPFTYSTSENSFSCEIPSLPASSNNIYAFYGVNPNQINSLNKTAHVNLGDTTQSQNSESPTSHIAEYDILYGAVMGANKESISIEMNHSIVALEITIQNALAATQTIESVTVTTPDDVVIAGEYDISLGNNNIITYASNGSNSATVTFDAVELQGESKSEFTAWLAVAPFSLNNGESLTIEVTTSGGDVYRCVKTISNPGGKSFKAGSIMSTNIVLGENCNTTLPSSIVFELDMAGLAGVGFPIASNGTPTPDHRYTIGGYTFTFNSPTAYYLDNNEINFEGNNTITNDNPVTIQLPQKDGYKLSAVTLASKSINSEQRKYNFSIVKSNGDVVDGGKRAILSSDPKRYALSNTNGSDSYYIKIGNANKHNKAAILSYISLEYEKL